MNETPQQENVIDISTAKSFGSRVTKALSTMSTMSKITQPRGSRIKKQSKRRVDSGRRELSRSLSQMPLMDNHPSKGSPRDRLVKTVLVEAILRDIQITLDVHQSNGVTDVVPGLLLAMEVIGDEYT